MIDTVTVYTPDSPLRRPGRLLGDMMGDLVASRELAWRLFLRDVSSQYRQSYLGYIWAFVPPLVASLPFIYLSSQGVIRAGETPIPYAAYAVIGTILWQVFVDALNAPLRTVQASKSMLVRINLPKEAILLSALLQVVLGMLVRTPLLIGVMLLFGIVPPLTALLFPLALVGLILTGFVVGMLLVPIGLLYGDVAQAMPVLTTFAMLLTPVVYTRPKTGLGAFIATINPLAPLIDTARDWLTTGAYDSAPGLLAVTALSVLFLLIGWIAIRIAMPHIVARLGT